MDHTRNSPLQRTAHLVACVLLAASLHASLAHAEPATKPARVLQRFDIVNTTEFTAMDYHIRIESLDEEELTLLLARRLGSPATKDTQGNNTTTLNIGFTFHELRPGRKEEFSIEIFQAANEIRITDSYWTTKDVDGNSIRIGNATVPGFEVVGDPIYTIFNDLSDPIGIRNLQFLIDVPELPLDSIASIASIPGFGAPASDFILAAGASMSFDIDQELLPGNFLYARAEMFDPESGVAVGMFLQGHENPIPEPSTGQLAIPALALLAFFRLRGRPHRRGQPPRSWIALYSRNSSSP